MNFVFIICLNNFAWTQQNLGRHEKIGGTLPPNASRIYGSACVRSFFPNNKGHVTAWAQFCCKMWEDCLVGNQYSYRADAEVKFCKYRFPILFSRSVS